MKGWTGGCTRGARVWGLQAADICTVTSFWVGAHLGSPAGRLCFVVYMETRPSRRDVGP